MLILGKSLGDIRDQSVRTFEAKEMVFPYKGRGLKYRHYRLAQPKDHIKVLTHAESHQDWLLILTAIVKRELSTQLLLPVPRCPHRSSTWNCGSQ